MAVLAFTIWLDEWIKALKTTWLYYRPKGSLNLNLLVAFLIKPQSSFLVTPPCRMTVMWFPVAREAVDVLLPSPFGGGSQVSVSETSGSQKEGLGMPDTGSVNHPIPFLVQVAGIVQLIMKAIVTVCRAACPLSSLLRNMLLFPLCLFWTQFGFIVCSVSLIY